METKYTNEDLAVSVTMVLIIIFIIIWSSYWNPSTQGTINNAKHYNTIVVNLLQIKMQKFLPFDLHENPSGSRI